MDDLEGWCNIILKDKQNNQCCICDGFLSVEDFELPLTSEDRGYICSEHIQIILQEDEGEYI